MFDEIFLKKKFKNLLKEIKKKNKFCIARIL